MKHTLTILILAICASVVSAQKIDRKALLKRNNPIVTDISELNSLTVGNGDFAFTVDPTGLQTFPEVYSKGVPLGTMSSWAWHYNENKGDYSFYETLETHDFGHGHKEVYAGQPSKAELLTAGGKSANVGTTANEPQGNKAARRQAAVDFFRANPHRIHMGSVGFYGIKTSDLKNIRQELQLEQGEIVSRYKLNGKPVEVRTVSSPDGSKVAVAVNAGKNAPMPIVIRMPYPTAAHSDDACDWTKGEEYHSLVINSQQANGNASAVQMTHKFPEVSYPTEFGSIEKHDASYHFGIAANCDLTVKRIDANTVVVTPSKSNAELLLDWNEDINAVTAFEDYASMQQKAAASWHDFWYNGGVVDFSKCKDKRAKELERRVVLSQYLLAVNSGGETPPQETGLTYNSWFGKFHLEMIWWHQAQFALWGHPEKLHRTLTWYNSPLVRRTAKLIALRQGFEGLRWMKMTDKSGMEAPSKVGSFLLWQQPHVIHLAELLRRCYAANGLKAQQDIVNEFGDIVDETAKFMADFATYDKNTSRYILKGYIPSQETLRASEVRNSPYELSEFHLTLGIADNWNKLRGKASGNTLYNKIAQNLSPLASTAEVEGSAPEGWTGGPLYLAAETAKQTYSDERFTQDHMACLGALGIYPEWYGVNKETMLNTLQWVQDNWHWDHTWGWDHPMTAMCAVRLLRPDLALKSILAPHRTNTYLLNGHNYQDQRLRIYLPGNGALLQCVALMCAGWDGCDVKNPGFPKDGKWDVQWEGIQPLP